MCLHVVLD